MEEVEEQVFGENIRRENCRSHGGRGATQFAADGVARGRWCDIESVRFGNVALGEEFHPVHGFSVLRSAL